MRLTIKMKDGSETTITGAFGWCSKDTFRYASIKKDMDGFYNVSEFEEVDWNEIDTIYMGD